MTGQQLGHYRVGSKLGEGGMGVVYRAHDTRLGRDVAIKVLPDSVARDPERLARFEREARTLAALNHPNIAAVYGVEQGALVMELVEGETLKGPLPLTTAINYARQIADALEAAHERGIIHRDLKPANIKITPDGKVKLLDFGLAKAMEQGPIAESSPTLTAHASLSGIIVGTPAYMSPEQARGTRVDHRTDIWAFGVVLYEMATGRRLYEGPTISDVMAAVLTREPPLETAPAPLRPLLARCLERDSRKRLGWIGEAPRYLDAPPARDHALPRWVAPAIALAAVIGAASAWLLRTPPSAAEVPVRAFSFTPNGLANTDYAHRAVISPNGKYIAYVAENRLWLRDLASEQSKPVEGGENAEGPFWSPDSGFIAFAAGMDLKKISAVGGVPSTLTRLTERYRGGAWNPDGSSLIVSLAGTGLMEVPSTGGTLKNVFKTVLGGTMYLPQFVPGPAGSRLLVAGKGTRVRQDLVWIDLKTGQSRVLHEGAFPAWSRTGHLLFQAAVRTSGLWAQPFSNGEPAGEAVPVLSNGSDFSAAEDGTVMWVDLLGGFRRLAWIDRAGKHTPLPGAPQTGLSDISLSADGTRVAYTAEEQGNPDVWIFDLNRSVRRKATTSPTFDALPRWAPSGKEFAFSSFRSGTTNGVFIQPADGTAEPKRMAPNTLADFPQSWTPDGKALMFLRTVPQTGYDLWIARRKADGSFEEAATWLQTPFNEYNANFSPDGRYVLYTSNESGHAEVYIRAFPGRGDSQQISSGGGEFGRWSRDGKEIFYVQGSALMAVPVAQGEPQELFRMLGLEAASNRYPYDVSPDGKRFLIGYPADAESAKPAAIHVVQNWPALLRGRRP
jgi:Tol biopolymer transport system component/predicted Ser/Thr protein kinase